MKRSANPLRGLMAVMILAMITPAPGVRAEIVDTDAMSAPTQAEQDRAKVQQFLDNATVKEKLSAMGVSGVVIDSRLAALTPAEIHALAQRIDAMPAGGVSFSDTQIIIVILLCILVAVLVA